MEYSIKKMVFIIIVLISIIITLFVIARMTTPPKEENTNNVENAITNEDEALEKIIEDSIKDNNNIIVNDKNQTITYEKNLLETDIIEENAQ